MNRFGSFVPVFLVLYLRHRGFSPTEAGAAVSAYGAGAMVAALTGGAAADRIGRRETIVISMVGSAASMLALWQASPLWAILALAVASGLFSELYRPASSALLADITEPGQRVAAFGVYRFAINLGFAAGPATAGLLAEHSFGLVFAGDAVTSLVYAAVALVWLPRATRSPRTAERRAEALRTIAHDRAFLFFLGASLFGALVYMQQQSTVPLALADGGHSSAFYGGLMSLNGLLVAVVELPLIAFTRRLPPRRVMAVGQLLVGAGLALTGVSTLAGLLLLAAAVWTFGEMLAAPVGSAYVADLAPEHLRGRYAGAWSLTWSIGLLVGPAVGTALYAWQPSALWFACLGSGCVAALLVLAARPRPLSVMAVPA